jgi:hypothetical protein
MDRLPQDLFRRILALIGSYGRAIMCQVNQFWSVETIAVSRLLCICPRVYNTGHKITLHQCTAIVEDGDYHTFARHQSSIIAYAKNYHGSQFLELACNQECPSMVLPLFKLGCIMYRDYFISLINRMHGELFQQIIILHANRPAKSKMYIEYNVSCTPRLLKIACRSGYFEVAKILIKILVTYHDDTWKNKCLTIACTWGHSDICKLLVAVGADRCKNEGCKGH